MLAVVRQQDRDEPSFDDEEYDDEEYYQDQQAGIGLKINETHLTTDMFNKVQTIYFHMEINGSPEEFQGAKADPTWSLKPHITKHLKQIMATKNRDRANGEDLAGNLQNCIPLCLEIVSDANSFPYTMGFMFPGMVPKVLTSHGRHTWATAADAPKTMVNRKITDPSNIFTQFMYDNWSKCSLESLDEDIHHLKGKNKGFSNINVGSLPYKVLLDNLDDQTDPNKEDAIWLQYNMTDEEIDAIYDAEENTRIRQVMVPTAIAQDIYDKLKGPLEEIRASFTKLDDMVVQFHRADGYKAWNDYRGLHGELVGNNADPNKRIRTTKLTKRARYAVMCKLDFLLF